MQFKMTKTVKRKYEKLSLMQKKKNQNNSYHHWVASQLTLDLGPST